MGILQKFTKAIFRSLPTRTLITNCTEIYSFDNNDKRVLISQSMEIVKWKTFSNRIEFSTNENYPTVVEVGIDRNLSHPPHYNVYRVYEPYVSRNNIDVITITPNEITVGKVSDEKIIVYKISKSTGLL
ncbi:MAG: hypothetical protein K9J25_07900 [Bacteroidales bacterium]|nr:hypothetical protein [Bacteroidales bacterium]